jgi:hypothetical protein
VGIFLGFTFLVHRIIVVVEAPSAGTAPRMELSHGDPALAAAVVVGIGEIERSGQRVVRVGEGTGRPSAVIAAADLILRLRELSALLSEEELLVLLELLPL